MSEMEKLFFDDIHVIIRTVLIGIMAYLSLILILRVSGKRTLTKMNAFDLIVTVALGSILASIMTSKDITLAQGITAFMTLVILQFILTKLSYSSSSFSKLVKSNPALLFYQGEFLREQLKKERILEIEIYQAIRSSGHASLDEVQAVILETDGTLSVISNSDQADLKESALFTAVDTQ